MENLENREMPKNNMALSIVATIIGLCSPCCIGFILGIVAIVMSTQVKKKFEAGDFEGAEKSSKNSKLLAFIALGLFVLTLVYWALNWDNMQLQIDQIQEQIEQMQNQ